MTHPEPPQGFNPSVTKIRDTALTDPSAPDGVPEGDETMSRDQLRNASYDYARLLAVIGIIWFHAGAPGALLGYSGLSFFLVLLMALALPQITMQRDLRHRAHPALRYAAARGRRLLVPWLVASAFYGGLKLLEISRGAPFASEFNNEMWLTGTALHLWFLPFAFAMCIALWPLGRWLRTAPDRVWTPFSFAMMGLALAALAFAQDADLAVPVAQWVYALPSILLGVAIGLTRGNLLHMLGLTALFICCALSANWTAGLFEISIAVSVLIVCSQIYIRPSFWSGQAAKASLRVYLIHPAVMTLVLRGGLAEAHSTASAIIVTVLCLGIVAIWETVAIKRDASAPQLT